jgi:chemotaxis protein MotB
MKIRISILAMLAVAVLGQSCVSTQKYKELQSNYDQLQNDTRNLNVKYQTSEQSLAVAKNRITSLDEQIASEKANAKSLYRMR